MALPPSDRAAHIAHELSIVSSTLLATATLLFIARIWTRSFPVYRMLADDYMCAVAYVFVVINTSLFFKSIEWTFPTWNQDWSQWSYGDTERSAFYGVIAQPFWACGMASIKISIGLMLLRLEADKQWRRFLWAMVAFQVVLSSYSTLTQLLGCMPLRKAWDMTGSVSGGRCWPSRIESASQVTVQVFVILTDWTFALIPIHFLRKVQRPLRERLVIGFLMSLGLFTGVASIFKIQQILAMRHSSDFYATALSIEMWCSVEVLVAFNASCVPCLRGSFQRALEHLGIVTLHQTTTYPYGHYPGTKYSTKITSGSTAGALDPPIRMKRPNSPGGESVDQIILDSEPAGRHCEIWRTTEVLMEEEHRPKPSRVVYGKSSISWSGLTASRRSSRG